MKFSSFLDVKNKETIKKLETIKNILSKSFIVEAFLEKSDPYIYIKSNENLPFEGVRIYKIGSNFAYRIQNESETQPYGKAYILNLENTFNNIISDMSEEEAGEFVAQALVQEFDSFFKQSSEAQKEYMLGKFDKKDITNSTIVSSNSGDFMNSIYK